MKRRREGFEAQWGSTCSVRQHLTLWKRLGQTQLGAMTMMIRGKGISAPEQYPTCAPHTTTRAVTVPDT